MAAQNLSGPIRAYNLTGLIARPVRGKNVSIQSDVGMFYDILNLSTACFKIGNDHAPQSRHFSTERSCLSEYGD